MTFALLCSTLLILTAGLAAAADTGGAAGAASEEPWAYDLASDLMSPFCPGRTLASCPSPQAAELVQWMVLQQAAGSTREEVVATLVDRFGEEILGAPPARGITLWAYVFPVLGFVVGGGLAVLVLRRIVRRGGSPEDGGASGPRVGREMPPGPDDDDLARTVDRELEARV
jgi:cytochrome c-type biogenesis protein CcmH